MIFTETPLSGAFVIEVERLEDSRGFFARTFCTDEFRAHGLDPHIAQCNISYNTARGTLRGLHYQRTPHGEPKCIRVTAGSIWDVIVDLRAESPTYKRSFGIELSAASRRMLYVPEGFAHGFVTLVEDSEVCYQMGRSYVADSATGVRWNDPAFAIEWPLAPVVISERDASWQLWNQ